MKWAFAGTPIFAERIFSALLDVGYTPEFVLTQPDRPAGRGMKLTASPVKVRAQEAGVPVFQPERLKNNPEIVQQLKEAELDVLIVVAYGLILPVDVLALPQWGCWNVHASLLPRWRGAAPIHRAIEAGDTQSGVTIMLMEAGLDTGPIYHTLETPITPEDTTATLHDRLAELGAHALLDTLAKAEAGTLPPPNFQPVDGICYAEKIHPEEARLNWSEPAEIVERHIRAFNPTPGAWTLYQGERLKIWSAQKKDGSTVSSAPGTVIEENGQPVVICGQGTQLQLSTLQRAGAQRVEASSWWLAQQQSHQQSSEQPSFE